MEQACEIIPNNNAGFRIFVVNPLYGMPHIHKEFEISCVLEGTVSVNIQGSGWKLNKGDLFVVNPYESHELHATGKTNILSLQVSYDFFSSYFPEIDTFYFDRYWILKDTDEFRNRIFVMLKTIARVYLKQDDFYSIRCHALINELFFLLYDNVGYYKLSDKDHRTSLSRGARMRRITRYIDEHYCDKLLLSDIAAAEDLSLHYLSHFFRDSYGMPFQDYLSRIRCEHARHMLLNTDDKLIDICNECGFSDPKYFMRCFRKIYGCSPREYRNSFRGMSKKMQQESLLTTQEYLSKEEALALL